MIADLEMIALVSLVPQDFTTFFDEGIEIQLDSLAVSYIGYRRRENVDVVLQC